MSKALVQLTICKINAALPTLLVPFEPVFVHRHEDSRNVRDIIISHEKIKGLYHDAQQ